MAKIKIIDNQNDLVTAAFYCPGCNEEHNFKYYSDKNKYIDPNTDPWRFNYDFNKPTITPSILVTCSHINQRCHSYITDGVIKYLDDCSHFLKGTTIELSEIEE